MRSKRMLISLMAAGMVAGTMSANATIETNLKGMFDNMGVYSNVTGSKKIEGQSRSIMTGGSVYMRAPSKTTSLYSIAPPGISAGCGGIDLFGGSFSFINKDEFVALMRNIGNNSMGLAFQLAIDAMSPMLGINMKDLRSMISKLNMNSINSCKSAKMLVGGIADKLSTGNLELCARWKLSLGEATDDAEAKKLCQDSTELSEIISNVVSNPATKEQAPASFTGGNILWDKALKKANISSEDAQLIMAITGVVLYEQGADKQMKISYKPSLVSDVEELLFGKSEASDGKTIALDVYNCTSKTDADGNVYEKATCVSETKNVHNFRYLVSDRMNKIVNTMNDASKVTTGYEATELTNFQNIVESTTVPLVRLLAYDAATGLDTRSAYLKLITLEYVGAIAEEYSKLAKRALGQSSSLSGPDTDALEKAEKSIESFQKTILKRKTKEALAVRTIRSIESDILNQERLMRSALANRLGG